MPHPTGHFLPLREGVDPAPDVLLEQYATPTHRVRTPPGTPPGTHPAPRPA
ncbi:hypothetical protein ACWEPM_03600 [Streptomyces sp. NPDC004244]